MLKHKLSLKVLGICVNTNWCQPCAARLVQLFKVFLEMFEILSPKLSYYQIWPHEEGSLLYPRGGCLWNPIRNQANEKNTTFSYSISMLLFLLYLKAVFKHLTLGFKDKKRLIFIQKFLYSKNIFKTCKLKLPPNKSNLDIPLLSSQIIFFLFTNGYHTVCKICAHWGH